MTDLSTGLYAKGAILAGLLQRQQTGHGQWIQCSLLSSQVTLIAYYSVSCLHENLVSVAIKLV